MKFFAPQRFAMQNSGVLQKFNFVKFFWEFDPGSGWTLAACLKHASHGDPLFLVTIWYDYDMHYVYVLKSQKYENLKLYFGSTSDLKRRLVEHNSSKTSSTKYGIPWKLVYCEAFLNRKDAVAREKRLKQGTSAIGFLKRRIKFSLE